MSKKIAFHHLITLLIFVIYALVGQYIEDYINHYRMQTYNPLIVINMIVTMAFNSGVGILLAYDYFLNEKKKEGSWKVDKYKLFIICIPALFLSVGSWIYYLRIPVLSHILQLLVHLRITALNIFQILFGYTLTTSFFKNDSKSH
ncbi:hypothetical protein [Anoxynatronum buryatiense]|uniref:Uncharacterized protein n=1 Tax=Anoxynatronum buryatiense TaxID=489973 RepID=A0AA46AJY2_9CLOT|nr:hypothetical protein [Anoxynatronum buryatiense]SMP65717.1 hypothetical protein SAMN06296020_11320 [Anoxynatronum buryatiense]